MIVIQLHRNNFETILSDGACRLLRGTIRGEIFPSGYKALLEGEFEDKGTGNGYFLGRRYQSKAEPEKYLVEHFDNDINAFILKVELW